jgi:endonuclease/exonuclease/phosphatase family metal-dependent hydrolase
LHIERIIHSVQAGAGPMEDVPKITVMQFNIRTGWADWGWQTAWFQLLPGRRSSRRSSCVACISEYFPDVVATQEGLNWQMRDLVADLGGRYRCIGRPRGTHYFNDETSAILYDQSRWEVQQSGDFMFSPTPQVWGSSYDGASWPMITTWTVLVGRGVHTGRRMIVVSTHLDPMNVAVRTASSRQLLEVCEQLRVEHNCENMFLLGDFNADCQEECLTACAAAGWMDAYTLLHGNYLPGSYTYHGFSGVDYDSKNLAIDFVLFKPADLQVDTAVVDTHRYGPDGKSADGFYPSDHYPIVVDFSFREKTV